jgi:hypothetical protein
MLLTDDKSLTEGQPAQLAKQLQDYLGDVLGVTVSWQEWEAKSLLPVHLAAVFSFRKTQLLDCAVVVAIDRGHTWTPAALEKQLGIVAQAATAPVLFVSRTISAFTRAQLIKHKIAFAMPGQQLFLPPLGVDFHERYLPEPPRAGHLTPAAQVTVIYALLNPIRETFQPKDFSGLLQFESNSYTPMTMTRVFNELEANGLAHSEREGRGRVLRLNARGRALWELAKPVLVSPVGARIWESGNMPIAHGVVAGLSALSDQSNLGPPELPVIAVPPKGWGLKTPDFKKEQVFHRPQDETREIEIWTYPPQLLSREGKSVDPFSLYLSLRDFKDERVEQALELFEENLWLAA